ncbi:MAG: hypothetical protein J1E06_07985 [Acutalibacter sp.]|nr:hypothetical protein [Acutalibacter sp.]
MIKNKICAAILCAALALLLTGCQAGNTVSRVTSKAGDTVSKAGEDMSKAESRMESDDRTDSDLNTSSDHDTSRDDSAIGDNSDVLTPDDDMSGLENGGDWAGSDLPADDTSSDLS